MPPVPAPPAPAERSLLAQPEIDRRRRLSVGFGQLGCLFGSLFAAFYFLIGHPWGGVVVTVCTGAFAGILFVSKRGDLNLAGNGYAAVLAAGFTALTAIEGGVHGHAVAWMACVPLCACLFVGPRAGWLWCGVCLVIVGVFGALACFEVRFPTLYPARWEAAVEAAGYVSLTLFMATLGLIFEGGRRRAFHELRAALNTLGERNDAITRSLEELRQSEGRFRSLFENSALGVALLNRRGEVEMANGRLAALLGTAPGEKVWLTGMVVTAERHDFLRYLRKQEGRSPGPREGREFQLHVPGRTGPRLFRCFLSWIAETGQVCALLNDITERRATERSVVQLEKSALLDSLVGGIAHELNNKLTPIVGFAELLVAQANGRLPSPGEGPDPEFAARCELIRDGAVEASTIVAQLLQLSRPAAVNLEPCDLRQVAEQACAVLPFRLREAGCHLTFELPGAPVPVSADRTQLKQVVLNLVINAIDAVESAPLRQVCVRVARDGNSRALLTVTDTGHGITEEVRAHMFEPFFTTKPLGRGTGLGLSVCAGIVKRHGGEIAVESQPGEGTAVSLRLPLAPELPPATRSPSPPSAHAAAGTTSNGASPAAPERGPVPPDARVLVIDDEEVIAEFVAHVLQTHLGCRVERVGTGEEAITHLEDGGRRFDLVVSDIRLPGISGLDVLSWIRQRRPELLSRVVMMTGDPGSAELHAQLTTLDVTVLQKPFLTENLIARCRTVIRREGEEDGATPGAGGSPTAQGNGKHG